MRSLQMDVDDEISNLVDLHMGMFGGGWKWQDLQGLLWLKIHCSPVPPMLLKKGIDSQKQGHRPTRLTSFKIYEKISSMRSEIMASCEDCLDGEGEVKVESMGGEGKLRLEKLVEVSMYSLMEVRKVGREGQGKVKGGGVDFGVINSLLGEILGEVMGEME
ncbi:hypothetical protein Tco_1318986 [Tanacetum coccineum]